MIEWMRARERTPAADSGSSGGPGGLARWRIPSSSLLYIIMMFDDISSSAAPPVLLVAVVAPPQSACLGCVRWFGMGRLSLQRSTVGTTTRAAAVPSFVVGPRGPA